MRLVSELREEHRLIEQVAGALITYVRTRGAPPEDRERFVTFFRVFADAFHHQREEDVLFAALIRDASLPADRGPLAALRKDHRELEELLSRFDAEKYVELLLHHIDAENSVLFVEGEERLRRAGVRELPVERPSPEALEAKALGSGLVRRYPPTDDGMIRGDGCVLCPRLGAGCEGLEEEWWTDSEWDEVSARGGVD